MRLALLLAALSGCAPTAAGVAVMDYAEKSPLDYSIEGYRDGEWEAFQLADMRGRYLLVHGAGYW